MSAAGHQTLTESVSCCNSQLRVALVCDFPEEGWHSMDLFGDMLQQQYRQNHANEIASRQLHAPFRLRFSGLFPHSAAERLLWNADRFINRFRDYPRWLKTQVNRFDLFHLIDHSYGQLVSALPPERTIVTCHDLDTFRCLLEPQIERRPKWFRAMTQKTLSGFLRAAYVICPSNSTRTALLDQGWFSQNRISVIYPGVDPVFFSAAEPKARQNLTEITGGSDEAYLLHVGSTARRKRIDVLIRVLAAVSREFPKIRLVRVGGALTADQKALAAGLGVADRIFQAPLLSKDQLASIYRQAIMLLQPSDAEGFGLPVIEAMACGCPVVASDIAALREAGGTAARYCPPADIEAWSERIIEMLREREAAPGQWERRRADASRHASGYTWQENARQTLAVYQSVWRAVQSQ